MKKSLWLTENQLMKVTVADRKLTDEKVTVAVRKPTDQKVTVADRKLMKKPLWLTEN